jgi:hypothetical protein
MQWISMTPPKATSAAIMFIVCGRAVVGFTWRGFVVSRLGRRSAERRNNWDRNQRCEHHTGRGSGSRTNDSPNQRACPRMYKAAVLHLVPIDHRVRFAKARAADVEPLEVLESPEAADRCAVERGAVEVERAQGREAGRSGQVGGVDGGQVGVDLEESRATGGRHGDDLGARTFQVRDAVRRAQDASPFRLRSPRDGGGGRGWTAGRRRQRLAYDVHDQPQVYLALTDAFTNCTVRYLVPVQQRRRWSTELILAISRELERPEHRGRIVPGYPRTQVDLAGELRRLGQSRDTPQ